MSHPFDFVCEDATSKVVYRPWTDGWAVGFQATHPDGRVEYIYLNPSGETDVGVPIVFLYQGVDGHPAHDDSKLNFRIDVAYPAPEIPPYLGDYTVDEWVGFVSKGMGISPEEYRGRYPDRIAKAQER